MKPKGRHTKPGVWDKARRRALWRWNSCLGKRQRLEPGVNYFVLALERLGCRTFQSCEGHPRDFYIVFKAPYRTALRIHRFGFFSVEIEREHDLWSLRVDSSRGPGTMVDCLRWAAEAWEKGLARKAR